MTSDEVKRYIEKQLWTHDEKIAACELFNNYMKWSERYKKNPTKRLSEILDNWKKALEKIGITVE